jgi:ribose 5-phosphate isomerase B
MVLYIGSDHRGFQLKEVLKRMLQNEGYQVSDLGAPAYDENDDYPDIAHRVAKKVSDDENARAVLVCGSGIGVAMVANKFQGVRAGVVLTPDQAFDAKNDDDINVLCFAADYTDEGTAKKILTTWLQTPFSAEERFNRRLREISAVEFDLVKKVQADAVEDALRQRDSRIDL